VNGYFPITPCNVQNLGTARSPTIDSEPVGKHYAVRKDLIVRRSGIIVRPDMPK